MIEEAIATFKAYQKYEPTTEEELDKAIQLGIEALERVRQLQCVTRNAKVWELARQRLPSEEEK